jgi:xylulose-5-phosphate/fructose-6-phosphate phosphoketolase
MDAIDRIPCLRLSAAAVRQELANQRIACEQYAYEHDIDRRDITEWRFPHPSA